MTPKPHLEQSMQEEQIREALDTHWRATAAGDANAAAVATYGSSTALGGVLHRFMEQEQQKRTSALDRH